MGRGEDEGNRLAYRAAQRKRRPVIGRRRDERTHGKYDNRSPRAAPWANAAAMRRKWRRLRLALPETRCYLAPDPRENRALSSAGEHFLDMEGVASSILAAPTISRNSAQKNQHRHRIGFDPDDAVLAVFAAERLDRFLRGVEDEQADLALPLFLRIGTERRQMERDRLLQDRRSDWPALPRSRHRSFSRCADSRR